MTLEQQPLLFFLHNPLDMLLLAGGNHFVVEQDIARYLQRLSLNGQEIFKMVYAYILTYIEDDHVLSNGGLDAFLDQHKDEGLSWFANDFRSVPQQTIVQVSESFHARPAGYKDISLLLELAHKLNDKRYVHDLMVSHFPSVEVPGTRFVDALDDNVLREYLQRHGRVVAKPPVSAGGIGSFATDDTNSSYERGKPFLLQPYIAHHLSPSITYLVSDGGISEVCLSDQIIDGFQYRGTHFPSQTRFDSQIRAFSREFMGLLFSMGYRGYANLDFIETDTGFYTTELNARVPYSLYPLAFFRNQNQGMEKHAGFCARQGWVPLAEAHEFFRTLRERRAVPYFLKEEDGMLCYRCIEFTGDNDTGKHPNSPPS